jgi:hypothetical protein
LLGAFWFDLITMSMFSKWESRIRRKIHIPFVKHPISVFLFCLTVAVGVVIGTKYYLHFQRDAQVLADAIKHRYVMYYNRIETPFHPYRPVYKGACGTWLLLAIELVMEFLMSMAFANASAFSNANNSVSVKSFVTGVGQGMFLGTLFPALVIAGGLLLGQAPTVPAMVCVVVGILGMELCVGGFHPGGSKYFRMVRGSRRSGKNLLYPVFFLILAVVFGAAITLSGTTKNIYMSQEQKLLDFQHTVEKAAVETGTRLVQRIQAFLGLEQPGVLTNTAPSYNGDTIMTLTTDQKPADDIYLRGFVGTKYEDGKWSTQKTQVSVADYFSQETCYQLLTQDYSLYQAVNAVGADDNENISALMDALASTDSLSGENDISMTITYPKNNLSTFAYFPYYAKLSQDSMGVLMLDYDRGFRRSRGVTQYKITLQKTRTTVRNQALSVTNTLRKGIVPYYEEDTSLSTVMGSTPSLTDSITVFEIRKKDIFSQKTYDSMEDVPSLLGDAQYVAVTDQTIAKYFQYVMAEDLWLPSGLTKTKKLAKKLSYDGTVDLSMVDSTPQNLIAQMQYYFRTNTTYSTRLQSVEGSQDYVEYFLFTQKKGYCEHYATAGAVLFRAMGVPARYVSGYKVSASDFKKNKDGTYTAKVLDTQAHAWTEIYTLNGGWTVADMTPSSDGGQESTYAQGASTAEPDYGDDEFLENDPESTEKAAADDDEEDDEETPQPEITPQATDGVSTEQPSGGETKGGTDGGNGSGGANSSSTTKLFTTNNIVAGTVCLLILLLGILWYSQDVRRKRQFKKCSDSGEYLLLQNKQLEDFLHCCGYGDMSQFTDREYLDLLGKIDPKGRENGDLENYYGLLQEARFYKPEGLKKEREYFTKMCMRIRRKALASRGILRTIYVRVLRRWSITR